MRSRRISLATSEWLWSTNCWVTSVPARLRITHLPPGCLGRYEEMSKTLLSTTTQQSSKVLCLATSSRVYFPIIIMDLQEERVQLLKKSYAIVPDFPKKGIAFMDINPIFASPKVLHTAIDAYEHLLDGLDFDKIAGLESRGFLFGAPLAYKMNKPFILIRKKGKLAGEVHHLDYDLEYGTDSVQLQKGAILPGEKVVLIDDVLATGGTMSAAVKLVKVSGGEISRIVILADIPALKGASKLGEEASKLRCMIHLE